MESEKLKLYNAKLKIASLIENVILEKISVKHALENFPSDFDDLNIKCVFDALMYREADEDIRAKDAEYARIQDDYLLKISEILKENEQLPVNIINKYLQCNESNVISKKYRNFHDAINYLKRMINF